MLKILCVGPLWRGSNAGGLFKALARQGSLIEVIDEFYEIPLRAHDLRTKFASRLMRGVYVNNYNKRILTTYKFFRPDVVLIYKGSFIYPETLIELRKLKAFTVNFYPDVSFHTHGRYLTKSLPLYDIVFTTKSFGVRDMREQLNIQDSYFIPHGFDPEIHRYFDVKNYNNNLYDCDVGFIGTWSPKKESLLKNILDKIPAKNLKIFGNQWKKAKLPVREKWMGREVLGDNYAIAINSTKINLGLLSERIKGASSGDQITSRTFHIPACNGFLLHEKTDEVADYFTPDKEIVCFGNGNDMIERIKYYLENQDQLEEIAKNGHKRALKDHSLDNRAIKILKILKSKI